MGIKRIWRMSALHLSATLCAIFVVLLLISGWATNRTIRAEVRAEIDAGLIELAESDAAEFTVASDVISLFAGDNEAGAASLTEGYLAPDETVHGQLRRDIFDQTGFLTLPASALFNEAGIAELREDWRFPSEEAFQPEAGLWRVYVLPLAGGRMAYLEEIEDFESVLAVIPGVVAGVGIPAIVATLLAGLGLGWRQQRRLDRISGGLARIADGDFSQRIAPARLHDDLDQVMWDVDGAAIRLQGSFDQLRYFTQHLAHELRTPLARLRASIEDLGDGPANLTVLDRTDEVIRIFDAVQRIARLSGRDGRAGMGEVDLGQVAQLMEDLFAEIADHNGQRLQLRLSNPAIIRGDQQLIAQLVSNLVDNAVRHSGAGSTITLAVEGDQITVTDTGPGIEAEKLSRLCTPFDQLGNNQTFGMGLGLALVRAIADYHRATMSVGKGESGGLCIVVRFSQREGSPFGRTLPQTANEVISL